MKKILFIGDSITDVNRAKDENADRFIGCGYPLLVSSYLSMNYTNEFTCINRGISGDRIVDMYAKLRENAINLQPDYISILIGVNDVWHDINGNRGVDTDRFENIYELTIGDIKRHLPNTKIIMMEPFVLEGTATVDEGDRYKRFADGVKEKAEVAKRVADRYNIPFVKLQVALSKAADKYSAADVLLDGVHPTTFGHSIITEKWLEVFEKSYLNGKSNGYLEELTKFQNVNEETSDCKPTVVLIGDSIREGYCQLVKEKLADKFNVYYPNDNCRFAQYIMCAGFYSEIRHPENVKLVHWNCGHWDTAHFDGISALNDLETYKESVGRVQNMLTRRFPNAKIVFATTTPMNPKSNDGIVNDRTTEDIQKYNTVAKSVILNMGGIVNDLFDKMKDMDASFYKDYCHYTDKGFEILAEYVIMSILKNMD